MNQNQTQIQNHNHNQNQNQNQNQNRNQSQRQNSTPSSSFLFSPANPTTTTHSHPHSLSSSSNSSTSSSHYQPAPFIQIKSHASSPIGNINNPAQEKNTSSTATAASGSNLPVGLESSPSSTSRDSNQTPFSLSSSSSSSQSLQSALSWQTENTSFGNQTTSPSEDGATTSAATSGTIKNLNYNPNTNSNTNSNASSRPSSSNGYPLPHVQQSNLTSNQSEPSLTFTRTFPRFSEPAAQSNPSSAHQSPSNHSSSDNGSRSRRSSLNTLDREDTNTPQSRGLAGVTATNTAINSRLASYPSLPTSSFQNSHNPFTQRSFPHPLPSPNYDPYSNQSHLYSQHLMSSGIYPQDQGTWSVEQASSSSPPPPPPPLPSPPKEVVKKHRVTTTFWEDEGTLCYQVDSKGFCVARRDGE